jgi:cytochrome c peroxidase
MTFQERGKTRLAAATFMALVATGVASADPDSTNPPMTVPLIGERPAVDRHLEQSDIDQGVYSLEALLDAGQQLFDARFNLLDGQGRPLSTGTGAPRAHGQPAFIRTSGPDSNSCAGCHNQPSSGGAGDFVANVFVLAQALDPVTDSVDGAFSNERNTPGMFGAGAIEMLAREMTSELVAIREAARQEAETTGEAQTRPLVAKDVHFGAITVLPDGRVDPSAIEGVDWDLIIKPFHQKGAVVSLREFSNNAMNHHHGMQSEERFEGDADGDGIERELTVGDITAVTIFQAALPAPGPKRQADPLVSDAIRLGRSLFAEAGCDACHLPMLVLESREFSEPNPWNPPGNLHPDDVAEPFTFDLVRTSKSSFVRPMGGGKVAVRALTDLKRHDLNDEDLNHFDNEQVPQGWLTGFADPTEFTIPPEPRPTGAFLTRKLWDAGNSGPYGHRGDLTTLTEAIWFHGGDARASRDAFFALSAEEQAAIIEYLKSLQMP